jgi:hypothetical protein
MFLLVIALNIEWDICLSEGREWTKYESSRWGVQSHQTMYQEFHSQLECIAYSNFSFVLGNPQVLF